MTPLEKLLDDFKLVDERYHICIAFANDHNHPTVGELREFVEEIEQIRVERTKFNLKVCDLEEKNYNLIHEIELLKQKRGTCDECLLYKDGICEKYGCYVLPRLDPSCFTPRPKKKRVAQWYVVMNGVRLKTITHYSREAMDKWFSDYTFSADMESWKEVEE